MDAQLWLSRPFGTEGLDTRIRFSGYGWTWEVVELADGWHVIDSGTARSSDTALARVQEALQEYREALLEAF